MFVPRWKFTGELTSVADPNRFAPSPDQIIVGPEQIECTADRMIDHVIERRGTYVKRSSRRHDDPSLR